MGLPKRNELSEEETWDISLLYKNQLAFEADVTLFKEKLNNFHSSYQNKLTNVEEISKAIMALNDLTILLDWITSYGHLPFSVNRENQQHEENANLVENLAESYHQNTAFFIPEILSLDESILKEVRHQPSMKDFIPFLDKIECRRESIFDEKTESILGALSGTIYGQEKIFSAIKFDDLTFNDFVVDKHVYQNSFPNFEGNFENHPNIHVRHAAWESFHSGLAKYQHVAAKNYISLVQTHKKMATLRGFDSVFDFLLFDQHVPQESYHQIIDTLLVEWAPVMRRFAKMMQKELGLAKISLADIKSSFTTDSVPKISISESRQMVQAALTPLGDEYGEIIENAFEQRWIDYPMAQGKNTGGYCASPYSKPSFILLNWTGLLNEVLVLSHELGHAGHFSLSAKYNQRLVAKPSMYFVEAPSTCNEVITCQYLLSQPLDKADKRALIAKFIQSTYYHNMVTHLLEAIYQRKVYQAIDNGELLNTASLNTFFQESLEIFWGDSLVINDGADLTWMRQPHYFDGLYSYTYAAGLAIGTQIGRRIAQNDSEAIDLWLDVLKMGGTKSPLDLAKHAGIDMTSPEPLRQTITYVSELLDQIESLS